MYRHLPRIILSLLISIALGAAAAGAQSWPADRLDALEALVAELSAQLADTRQQVRGLEGELAEAKAANTWMADRLDRLEGSSVLALDKVLTYQPKRGTVLFSGVNVQITNGAAQETINGLGNLIVGFDEPNLSGLDDKGGSHNLVVGNNNSYANIGGVVFGTNNVVTGPYATVTGGQRNVASGGNASVSGGGSNEASSSFSSVSGGEHNLASNVGASVSGGRDNVAAGRHGSVSGGNFNTAGFQSNVCGGRFNIAGSEWSTITGGEGNTTTARWSTVSGGQNRTASGEHDWVAGSLFEDN